MNIKMISAQHSSNNGKNYVTRKTWWHVIVLNPVNNTTLKLTPREKIELEVVHISLKRDVSQHNDAFFRCLTLSFSRMLENLISGSLREMN